MHFLRSAMVALLGAVLVTACGGGGGGAPVETPVASTPPPESTPQPTPGGTWLTFAPVTVNTYAGESLVFDVKGTATLDVDKPITTKVTDSKNVVFQSPNFGSGLYKGTFTSILRTRALAAGIHTTQIEVRLCEDVNCQKQLSGSPWYVPVTVNVAPATEASTRLKLELPAPQLTVYEGEPVTFTLTGKGEASFGSVVHLAVSDSAGVLTPGAKMLPDIKGGYSAKLTTTPTLKPGKYDTSIQVRGCLEIDPQSCGPEAAGSPWRIPLRIVVEPATNLTPLSTVASLTPWRGSYGNVAYNAYVPASFDPASFSRRWSKPEAGRYFSGASVIDDGRVFVLDSKEPHLTELLAVSEADGTVLWRRELGRFSSSSPVAGNGKVYVKTSSAEGSHLWEFVQASGELIGKTILSPHSSDTLPLTLVGDMLYMDIDNGTLVKFNTLSKRNEWTDTALYTGGRWNPSLDGKFAYVYWRDRLMAVDTGTGSLGFAITETDFGIDEGSSRAPAISGSMAFVGNMSRLIAFDLEKRQRAWTVPGAHEQPVVAEGTVYALGRFTNVLQARSALSGALEWSMELKNPEFGPAVDYAYPTFQSLVVTANLVFVSSGKSTLAIDRASHKVVWSYPLGGELALSERGVLHIVSSNGKLAAINLR